MCILGKDGDGLEIKKTCRRWPNPIRFKVDKNADFRGPIDAIMNRCLNVTDYQREFPSPASP